MARSHTAADLVVERIAEWGIDVVFGLSVGPGGR